MDQSELNAHLKELKSSSESKVCERVNSVLGSSLCMAQKID